MGESIGEKEEAMRQISGVKTEVTKEGIIIYEKFDNFCSALDIIQKSKDIYLPMFLELKEEIQKNWIG